MYFLIDNDKVDTIFYIILFIILYYFSIVFASSIIEGTILKFNLNQHKIIFHFLFKLYILVILTILKNKMKLVFVTQYQITKIEHSQNPESFIICLV